MTLPVPAEMDRGPSRDVGLPPHYFEALPITGDHVGPGLRAPDYGCWEGRGGQRALIFELLPALILELIPILPTD